METHHPEGNLPLASSEKSGRKDNETVIEDPMNTTGEHREGGRVPAPSSPKNGSSSKQASGRSKAPASAPSSMSRKSGVSRSSSHSTNTVQAWRDIFSGHKSRNNKDSRRVRHKTKHSEGPHIPASSAKAKPRVQESMESSTSGALEKPLSMLGVRSPHSTV